MPLIRIERERKWYFVCDICGAAAGCPVDFTHHVNSVQMSQGRRAAKLRNITPIHGASPGPPPSVKVPTPTT